MVLLDTLVHELNTIRGAARRAGPARLCEPGPDHVTVMLRFGDLPVAMHWIDLPGIARYEMEFALYAPDRRLRLAFPSPFLRNEPAVLEIEGGDRELGPVLADRGGRRVRERVQARAGRVPRQHRHRPPAAHVGPGRPAGRRSLCQAIIDSHHRRHRSTIPRRSARRGRGDGVPQEGQQHERGHRGGERPGQLRGLRADRRPRPRRARRHHRPGPGGRGRVRRHRPRTGRLPGQRRAARRTAGRARPRPGRRLRGAAVRRSRRAGTGAARTGCHPGRVRRRPVLSPGPAAAADARRGWQPGAAGPARAFGPGSLARVRRRRVAAVRYRPGPGDRPLP